MGFIDNSADLGTITARSVEYQTELSLSGADPAALSFTGILLGNMDT